MKELLNSSSSYTAVVVIMKNIKYDEDIIVDFD